MSQSVSKEAIVIPKRQHQSARADGAATARSAHRPPSAHGAAAASASSASSATAAAATAFISVPPVAPIAPAAASSASGAHRFRGQRFLLDYSQRANDELAALLEQLGASLVLELSPGCQLVVGGNKAQIHASTALHRSKGSRFSQLIAAQANSAGGQLEDRRDQARRLGLPIHTRDELLAEARARVVEEQEQEPCVIIRDAGGHFAPEVTRYPRVRPMITAKRTAAPSSAAAAGAPSQLGRGLRGGHDSSQSQRAEVSFGDELVHTLPQIDWDAPPGVCPFVSGNRRTEDVAAEVRARQRARDHAEAVQRGEALPVAPAAVIAAKKAAGKPEPKPLWCEICHKHCLDEQTHHNTPDHQRAFDDPQQSEPVRQLVDAIHNDMIMCRIMEQIVREEEEEERQAAAAAAAAASSAVPATAAVSAAAVAVAPPLADSGIGMHDVAAVDMEDEVVAPADEPVVAADPPSEAPAAAPSHEQPDAVTPDQPVVASDSPATPAAAPVALVEVPSLEVAPVAAPTPAPAAASAAVATDPVGPSLPPSIQPTNHLPLPTPVSESTDAGAHAPKADAVGSPVAFPSAVVACTPAALAIASSAPVRASSLPSNLPPSLSRSASPSSDLSDFSDFEFASHGGASFMAFSAADAIIHPHAVVVSRSSTPSVPQSAPPATVTAATAAAAAVLPVPSMAAPAAAIVRSRPLRLVKTTATKVLPAPAPAAPPAPATVAVAELPSHVRVDSDELSANSLADSSSPPPVTAEHAAADSALASELEQTRLSPVPQAPVDVADASQAPLAVAAAPLREDVAAPVPERGPVETVEAASVISAPVAAPSSPPAALPPPPQPASDPDPEPPVAAQPAVPSEPVATEPVPQPAPQPAPSDDPVACSAPDSENLAEELDAKSDAESDAESEAESAAPSEAESSPAAPRTAPDPMAKVFKQLGAYLADGPAFGQPTDNRRNKTEAPAVAKPEPKSAPRSSTRGDKARSTVAAVVASPSPATAAAASATAPGTPRSTRAPASARASARPSGSGASTIPVVPAQRATSRKRALRLCDDDAVQEEPPAAALLDPQVARALKRLETYSIKLPAADLPSLLTSIAAPSPISTRARASPPAPQSNKKRRSTPLVQPDPSPVPPQLPASASAAAAASFSAAAAALHSPVAGPVHTPRRIGRSGRTDGQLSLQESPGTNPADPICVDSPPHAIAATSKLKRSSFISMLGAAATGSSPLVASPPFNAAAAPVAAHSGSQAKSSTPKRKRAPEQALESQQQQGGPHAVTPAGSGLPKNFAKRSKPSLTPNVSSAASPAAAAPPVAAAPPAAASASPSVPQSSLGKFLTPPAAPLTPSKTPSLLHLPTMPLSGGGGGGSGSGSLAELKCPEGADREAYVSPHPHGRRRKTTGYAAAPLSADSAGYATPQSYMKKHDRARLQNKMLRQHASRQMGALHVADETPTRSAVEARGEEALSSPPQAPLSRSIHSNRPSTTPVSAGSFSSTPRPSVAPSRINAFMLADSPATSGDKIAPRSLLAPSTRNPAVVPKPITAFAKRLDAASSRLDDENSDDDGDPYGPPVPRSAVFSSELPPRSSSAAAALASASPSLLAAVSPTISSPIVRSSSVGDAERQRQEFIRSKRKEQGKTVHPTLSKAPRARAAAAAASQFDFDD